MDWPKLFLSEECWLLGNESDYWNSLSFSYVIYWTLFCIRDHQEVPVFSCYYTDLSSQCWLIFWSKWDLLPEIERDSFTCIPLNSRGEMAMCITDWRLHCGCLQTRTTSLQHTPQSSHASPRLLNEISEWPNIMSLPSWELRSVPRTFAQ